MWLPLRFEGTTKLQNNYWKISAISLYGIFLRQKSQHSAIHDSQVSNARNSMPHTKPSTTQTAPNDKQDNNFDNPKTMLIIFKYRIISKLWRIFASDSRMGSHQCPSRPARQPSPKPSRLLNKPASDARLPTANGSQTEYNAYYIVLLDDFIFAVKGYPLWNAQPCSGRLTLSLGRSFLFSPRIST